jgi:NADPH:quinone reductase-like Zn-dependent oxidoreductase
MQMMRAAVLREPGGPEQLRLESVSIPAVNRDQVLIRVKAFGLNRSEMFTRQGHSPDVKLPRILGIEAVGTVEEAPGNGFRKGDTVATVMGGMGRSFDGSYAEYTVVPASQVLAVHTELPWEVLGALPEMLQTAWGALHASLELQTGERLLIRGGTSSIGLAAMALAKSAGAFVSSTTRKPDRASFLRDHGADEVFIDTGNIQGQVRHAHPEGVEKILELVGTSTLLDSLRCARKRGVVCEAGIVGSEWSIKEFNPAVAIPTAVHLTTYGGTSADLLQMPFEALARQVATGALRLPLAKYFRLDEIAEAHRCMEENKALGKIVVLT